MCMFIFLGMAVSSWELSDILSKNPIPSSLCVFIGQGEKSEPKTPERTIEHLREEILTIHSQGDAGQSVTIPQLSALGNHAASEAFPSTHNALFPDS